MRRTIAAITSAGLCCLAFALGSATAADGPKTAKTTYQEHVAPIFRTRCGSCHNQDKQKGGLNLDNYGAAMQGGSSGKVVEPGDPDSSTIFLVVSHKEEPKMPPNSPRIPDAELETIRKWIEGGALESSGSVAMVKARPKFEFKLDAASMGKPKGEPAMPQGVLTEPFVPNARPGAVVAMAASPWAPLAAIAGHKQVLLYRTTDNHLVGVLPFPEGLIYTLKFSRSGDLLLSGGGRGGQSGVAVAWDVKKGTRVFEVGKEYDIVLAADITPDQSQVALGGPGKVVRIYNTADGSLVAEMRKHTEWITAVEYSPDGVLLATGDRNNGLIVWEARTAREYFDLRGHQAAISDVSWRLDSNVLASSSEDGSIRLWEMENGNNIKTIGAHGGGTLSVRFGKDGRLLSAGRDRVARIWDANGNKQRDLEPFSDLALEAVFTQDESRVIAADWTGEIRVYDSKDGKRLANLAVNPRPIAVRLEQTNQALAVAKSEADALSRQFAQLQADAQTRAKAVEAAQLKVGAADKVVSERGKAVAAAEQVLKARQATLEEIRATTRAAEQLEASTTAAVQAAEKSAASAATAEKAANDALIAARTAIKKAVAEKSAHDPALARATTALDAARTPAEISRASSELSRIAQRSVELAQAVTAACDAETKALQVLEQAQKAKTAAPSVANDSRLKAKAVSLAVQSARDKAARAEQDRAAAEKIANEARAAHQAAMASLAAAKKENDQALAQKAVAEKSLADRKPAVDAALARANALQAEAAALAVEKKQLNASGGLATAAKPAA